MYSITENIYYPQLSSVAILLQPKPNCFTSYNTRKWLFSLPLCYRPSVSPVSHVSSCNGQWSSQLFCVYYTKYLLYKHIRGRTCVGLRSDVRVTLVHTRTHTCVLYQSAYERGPCLNLAVQFSASHVCMNSSVHHLGSVTLDLWFFCWWVWRWLPSGMLCRKIS
jgi:hypothetical protein